MNHRIILIIFALTFCFATTATAQVLERRFGFRMTVQGVGNFTQKERPLESFTIKEAVSPADTVLRSDSAYTFKCDRRFMPKYAMNLGTEYLLLSLWRWSVN